MTEIEQFLGFGLTFGIQDSTASSHGSGRKEGGWSTCSIFLDTAFNTAAGDAKGTNNITLFTLPLVDQLGRKHAKGRTVFFRMCVDWNDPTKIDPLAVLKGNTENIIDRTNAVRYKW